MAGCNPLAIMFESLWTGFFPFLGACASHFERPKYVNPMDSHISKTSQFKRKCKYVPVIKKLQGFFFLFPLDRQYAYIFLVNGGLDITQLAVVCLYIWSMVRLLEDADLILFPCSSVTWYGCWPHIISPIIRHIIHTYFLRREPDSKGQVCVSLSTCLPGCFCLRPVFISLNPSGPQKISSVRSLVIEELKSRFLYPEELPSKSGVHGPYLDAKSVWTFLDWFRPRYISPSDLLATLGGSYRLLLTCGAGTV